METHQRLRQALVEALADMGFGSREEPTLPNLQMLTNALGLCLAHRWALKGHQNRRVHKYFPTHERSSLARSRGNNHLRGLPRAVRTQLGVNRSERSFLLDFFAEEWIGGREIPILGAEVEAYTGHGVVDDIEKSDYQWDFYKLLYVRVPRRLFIARTAVARLEPLSDSLTKAWDRTRAAISQEADRLAVILLPAGKTQWPHVRLGIARGAEPLSFRVVTSF